MKKKATRSAGGGQPRPSIIGQASVNSHGPNYKDIGFNLPHTFAMKSPDSMFSQRSQYSIPVDYFEDPNMLEEEELENEEETLQEFFARMICMPLNEEEIKQIIDEDEEETEKEIEEFSGGGVAGVAAPLGKGPDGKVRPKGWRNSFNDYSAKTYGGGKIK